MQEWSYAEQTQHLVPLRQLQNPKPFVITVARMLPFICVHRPATSTHDVLSSAVAASGVDLKIDGHAGSTSCGTAAMSYVYVHHEVGLGRLLVDFPCLPAYLRAGVISSTFVTHLPITIHSAD
jgi:hypothetical protein